MFSKLKSKSPSRSPEERKTSEKQKKSALPENISSTSKEKCVYDDTDLAASTSKEVIKQSSGSPRSEIKIDKKTSVEDPKSNIIPGSEQGSELTEAINLLTESSSEALDIEASPSIIKNPLLLPKSISDTKLLTESITTDDFHSAENVKELVKNVNASPKIKTDLIDSKLEEETWDDSISDTLRNISEIPTDSSAESSSYSILAMSSTSCENILPPTKTLRLPKSK